jgi:hypothetical protein
MEKTILWLIGEDVSLSRPPGEASGTSGSTRPS